MSYHLSTVRWCPVSQSLVGNTLVMHLPTSLPCHPVPKLRCTLRLHLRCCLLPCACSASLLRWACEDVLKESLFRCPTPQVISTSGDTHLGGEDFDHRVMDYFIKLIKKKYKTDISKDNRALQKLRREAERAKRALSSQHQVRATPLLGSSPVGLRPLL